MTNHSKNIFLFLLFTVSLLFNIGCEKSSEPIPVNESELITTLRVTFVVNDPNQRDTVVLSFKDVDGDGGTAPVFTISKNFLKGKTYNATIELLDESKNPAGIITEEIQKEKDAHQFFFSSTNNLFSSITYTDQDGNNKPVGLAFSVTTNANTVTNATFKVTLRHKPNKSADGVASGNITNAGGETDISVDFGGISSN